MKKSSLAMIHIMSEVGVVRGGRNHHVIRDYPYNVCGGGGERMKKLSCAYNVCGVSGESG